MALDFSELIDARLVGVMHIQSSNDIVLTFFKRSKVLEMRALSVERVLISDFTEQNVVDEIILHKGGEHKATLEERVAELLFRCSAEAAIAQPSFHEKLDTTVREVEAGEKVFVEIIPAVGASLLMLTLRLELLEPA